MGTNARQTSVDAVNAAVFKPLARIVKLPALKDADGTPKTVTVLLGCRSISPAVVNKFMETYKPGDHVIISGGLKVQELTVAFGLITSGKFSEVFDFNATGAWKRGGLKERFTSQLCEAEYMKQQLLARGIRNEDIVAIDNKSTNTGQIIENILKALQPYEGIHFVGFYPTMMRALMTARNTSALNGKAISVEGCESYGITPKTWQNFWWLRGIIQGEAKKIAPEGSPGSYVGRFCEVVDVGAESARVMQLIAQYPPQP
jgi:hypothetical protein